ELAGFAKVHLAAGASETVTIVLPPRAFAFYDVEAADWRIPAGTFAVEVARSSVDIAETLTIEVKGGVSQAPEGPGTAPVAATDDQFAARLGRPVPRPRPVRPFTRQSSLGELRATRTGRLLNAILWRIAP